MLRPCDSLLLIIWVNCKSSFFLLFLFRLPDSDLLGHSISGVQMSKSQNEVQTANVSQNDMKHKFRISMEKEHTAKESTISRQLNFNITSESNKERPVISLFSKIQSINSSQGKKQDDGGTSPYQSQNLPVLAVNEMAIRNNTPFTMCNLSDEKPIVKPSEPNVTTIMPTTSVPAECDHAIILGKSNPIDVNNQNDSSSPPCVENANQSEITNNFTDITTELPQTDSDDRTPYKMFQMPSTRHFPSTNRRLVSNETKNGRLAVENEFRSQKVLFTTPSAVSRPVISLMNNVGLDDSLNCYKSSPIGINSSSETNKKYFSNTRTHSRVDAHDVMNSNEAIPNEYLSKKINDAAQIDDKIKIIRINEKDFVLQKKIGQGGSSSVYMAEHKDTKLECAVKVE